MPSVIAESIIDAVVGLAFASIDREAGNRLSLEGLTSGVRNDGALEVGILKLSATSMRVASGPRVLELGQLALDEVVALVRIEGGRPRLCSMEAARAEMSNVKLHAPLNLSRPGQGDTHASHGHGGASASGHHAAGPANAGSWCLGPLGSANGSIRAEIIDAHLLFDADVTVPIVQGRIDFNAATVEHVGPDSRMGVSRLGIYVDAPNGRSYLYQFASTPVAGVAFERRGALLGTRVTDRGHLQLQAFGEALLRQGPGGHGPGFTDQARMLFDRTAVSGDLRLGDGRFAAPGVQADLTGRAQGHNAIRLHSEAVGRGLTADIPSLSVRDTVLGANDMHMGCDEIAGAVLLRVFVEGAQLGLSFEVPSMKVSGLRLHRRASDTTAPAESKPG